MLALLVGCGAARTEVRGERQAECDAGDAFCSSARTPRPPCPEEMVLVAGRFCIDRYEASMVDDRTGQMFSPFYPPALDEMRKAVNGQPWGPAALGRAELRPPVPLLPAWQRQPDAKARAVSRQGVVPQGYLSKLTARSACTAAGKRLCTLTEWKLACRGEGDTRFPYGSAYRHHACNVHKRHHAAAILWGNASLGHWDPRLNQLPVEGSPLLKPTGETATCKSRWGEDAIYDMVGNLDEWVDDPSTKGTFVGGFYARDTVRGCDAKVSEHPAVFFDFSTGVRCCSDTH
jgi:formylglycine-generating enzyme